VNWSAGTPGPSLTSLATVASTGFHWKRRMIDYEELEKRLKSAIPLVLLNLILDTQRDPQS